MPPRMRNSGFIICTIVAALGQACCLASKQDNDVQVLFGLLDTNGDGVFSPLEVNEHFAGGRASFRSLEDLIGEMDQNSDSKFTIEDLWLLQHHSIQQVQVSLTGIH